jgi:hypothetical protein
MRADTYSRPAKGVLGDEVQPGSHKPSDGTSSYLPWDAGDRWRGGGCLASEPSPRCPSEDARDQEFPGGGSATRYFQRVRRDVSSAEGRASREAKRRAGQLRVFAGSYGSGVKCREWRPLVCLVPPASLARLWLFPVRSPLACVERSRQRMMAVVEVSNNRAQKGNPGVAYRVADSGEAAGMCGRSSPLALSSVSAGQAVLKGDSRVMDGSPKRDSPAAEDMSMHRCRV